MSLVEGRLWSKLWCYHDRPSPTLATIFGPVSKLRSQASLHGVNHNMPFPTALKSLFSTFSVLSEVSRPYHAKSFGKFDAAFYQEIMLSSLVFRRETASGFYPWGKVEDPRKRVAERLCGWRHGNSFPMTQSAQSHRQMRSIPRCPKAVFYVFCFWFHSQFGNIV